MITIQSARLQVQGRTRFLLILAVCALFALVASTLTTMGIMHRTQDVTVPDLSHKSVESARSVLRVKRLRIEISEYRYDKRIAANKILEQDPKPDTTVASGQAIQVVVSRGSQTLETPDVAGLTLTEAAGQFVNLSLNLGRVTRIYTTLEEKNRVLDQYPEAGTRSNHGDNVDLLVSRGPRPIWFIMPNLKGWHIDDAAGVLKVMGLELREVKRQLDDNCPTGMILEQTPPTGVPIRAQDPAGFVVTIQSIGQNTTSRLARIEYQVPAGRMEVRVKLMVRDDNGWQEIYNALEKPNSRISIRRAISGDSAELFIYLNGRLHEERRI